jgi:hypothetical protein
MREATMPTGTTIRRLLRRLLLWLAAALDEAAEPQLVTAGGPPADWLARVRRGAPDLLKHEGEGGVMPTHAESAPAPLRRSAPATAAAREPRRTRAVVEEELVARKGRPGSAQERGVVPVRLHPVINEPELSMPSRSTAKDAGDEKMTHSAKTMSSEASSQGSGRAGREAHALLPSHPGPSLDASSNDTLEMTSAATGAAGAPTSTSTPRSGRQVFSVARFAGLNQGTQAIPGLKGGSTDLALPPATAAGNDLERRETGGSGEFAPDAEDRPHAHKRGNRWPELSPTATFARAHREETIAEDDASGHRWPELPPLPPFADEQLAPVESFDDPDRLRRISAEQRRSGWSE